MSSHVSDVGIQFVVLALHRVFVRVSTLLFNNHRRELQQDNRDFPPLFIPQRHKIQLWWQRHTRFRKPKGITEYFVQWAKSTNLK